MTNIILSATVVCLCLVSYGCNPGQQNSDQAQQNTPAPTPTGSTTPSERATQTPSPVPRPPSDPRFKVYITEPAAGVVVAEKPFIEGTAADSGMKVWVIVHPTEAGDYWVQQQASVREDGTWRVQVHVGEQGTKSGTRFEIRAVANPTTQLSEGKVLDTWPASKWMSQIVEVSRQ
jgi:hypothetical protein